MNGVRSGMAGHLYRQGAKDAKNAKEQKANCFSALLCVLGVLCALAVKPLALDASFQKAKASP